MIRKFFNFPIHFNEFLQFSIAAAARAAPTAAADVTRKFSTTVPNDGVSAAAAATNYEFKSDNDTTDEEGKFITFIELCIISYSVYQIQNADEEMRMVVPHAQYQTLPSQQQQPMSSSQLTLVSNMQPVASMLLTPPNQVGFCRGFILFAVNSF